MPITLPAIDDRDFDSLVRDALARASVHTPEWTHTGPSDPGVTLVELFAFMAESLLYRANLIPERNRLKFLQLLGVKLLPAAPAHGLVQLRNESPGHISVTLAPGLQAFAGPLPFITDLGLDVPPVEGLAVFKRTVAAPDPALLDYYRQLYEATGRDLAGTDLAPVLYETVALDDLPAALDVGAEAVDGALWIALLAPKKASDAVRQQVRERLAACTLSIGLVPERADPSASLIPGASARPAPALGVWMPRTGDAASGTGGAAADGATAGGTAGTATALYCRLDAVAPAGFPDRAGILQVTMPAADAIGTWSIDEPLEAGVGELPPLLTDDELDARVLTWLRIDGLGTAGVRLRWAGIHCATVTQRSRVERETLAPGDGDVNQQRQLGHGQVLAESVVLAVGGQRWTLTDELEAAPAEGKPGATVFALDAEAGLLRFGDGVRGARPPAGAAIAVAYDWSNGADGNVAAGAITLAPDLPAGIKLANPVACTGGTAAETAADGERRIPLVLRHRDRAVSADDFAEILRAAPGADLGRAEVLAAWHPELSPALPGDQPGVVTCMVIPRTDAAHPDNPLPDADFINALCNHLAPRRLVTCEVLLRGPVYSGVWISVGIEIVAGQSVATVRDRVRAALRDHLSPLPPAVTGAPAATLPGLENGWPLFRAVTALELAAVVARTTGVAGVAGLLLGDASGSRRDSVPMQGLQLPFIAGLSVTLGDPVSLDDLVGRGSGAGGGDGGDGSGGNGGGTTAPRRLPVPKVPQEC
ncbi:baseplate J/gp47 family protein [Derxia gummosa]|uniref:Baseplate J/gp47 family protein n=1 Tax=Derxia gummosa DSM 723 TaxID=1121388 RepID=A0A8B6X1G8_9BURK|nr:baseplate J/gp47 family protein [Derxia gummosa]